MPGLLCFWQTAGFYISCTGQECPSHQSSFYTDIFFLEYFDINVQVTPTYSMLVQFLDQFC